MAHSLHASPKSFFVIAHNIRSLLNVGSIFRSSDAFGVTRLYLTGYTGRPDNLIHKAKITKTALGAEEFVKWEYKKSAVRVIKDLRVTYPKINIIGLENNLPVGAGFSRPQPLPKFKPTFPLALILGEEVKGISQQLIEFCDKLVEIPMNGQKESLNVSVAFGVAAYVLSSQR